MEVFTAYICLKVIVLYNFIILLNISVQIFSEKCNTKKKRGGALFGKGR